MPSLPLVIELDATNALADRWDLQRLPVRELHLQAMGRGRDLAAGIDLKGLDISFGSAKQEAGRVKGEGRWAAQRWQAQLQLEKLKPAALDQRAPAMTLSGTVDAYSEPAKTTAASAGARSLRCHGAQGRSSPDSAASDATDTPPISDWPVHIKTQLKGPVELLKPARDVTLSLDASLSKTHVVVRELLASSGPGRLQAQGEVLVSADEKPATHVKAKAELKSFEPALWWPGPAGSRWRDQLHKLNGDVDADLNLPARGPREAMTAWLARIAGHATARITDSTLGGLPLRAALELRSSSSRSGGLGSRGEVRLAGNSIDWQGAIRLRGDGADIEDAVRLNMAMPRLEELTPLARWWDPHAELGGSLTASARLEGAWPRIALQGELDATELRWGDLRAATAKGRWQFGQNAQQPQTLDVQVANLDAAGRRFSAIQLALQGTGLAHQLSLTAEALPAAAPAAATPAPGASGPSVAAASTRPADAAAEPPPKLRLGLQLRGGVEVPGADAPLSELLGWKGALDSLELRTDRPEAPPLVLTRNVEMQWQRGRSDPVSPQSFNVGAGRAELHAGTSTAAVRWSRILWQAAGPIQPGVLEAQAELEPFAIAPLLRDLQPGFRLGRRPAGGRPALDAQQPGLRGRCRTHARERRPGDPRRRHRRKDGTERAATGPQRARWRLALHTRAQRASDRQRQG